MTVSSAPPDGGWGWIVCCACFFAHVLTDGLFYSFGVVYIELLDYFQESKGETAIIGSLAPAVCFLSGPVVAVLVNKFGCRVVAIAGAFVAAISQFVSIFAPNIQFLYITLGVMTGLGYGLVYLPSIVAVSQYFTKRRAFATGLGVSGAGIGTFIFSPITNLLIQAYTWRGAILIESGLLLNCIACGLVYRPIAFGNPGQHNNKQPQPLHTITEHDDEVKHLNNESDVNKHMQARQDTNESLSDEANSLLIGNIPVESICNDDNLGESDQDMQIRENNLEQENISNNTVSYKQSVYSEGQINFKSGKKPSMCQLLKKSVSKHFNVEIFKSIPFCMFTASTFFYSLGYYVPYVYLPDTAREAGIDELSAAWLVSSVGITNTVGRIIFGFLSDRKGINRLILYNTSLVICGLVTTVGPLLKQFWSLLLYTMVFGVFSGVTISLTSVILADIVGIERLADAFGVNNFFAGVAAFAGPPLAGWLFDISGSYVVSYICAGVSIALSGAMLYFVPLCSTSTVQSD